MPRYVYNHYIYSIFSDNNIRTNGYSIQIASITTKSQQQSGGDDSQPRIFSLHKYVRKRNSSLLLLLLTYIRANK